MWVFVNGLKVIQNYTVLQWAWFFMFYCIFGWCFESTYCSLKSMRLMNRGFCHGPWLPIYGAGAVLFIACAWPYRANLFVTFLMGMLVGTGLELVTGPLMYHIFHMRWWDYSKNPLNWHGYICLYASLGWGAMALFFVHFLHPRVAELTVHWTPIGYIVIVTMLYTLFVEDVIFSVLGALDIKKRLENLAANSEEIQQLKLSITEAREHMEELQAAMSANVSEVKSIAESEGKLAAAKVVSEEAARALQEARENSAEAARQVARSSAQMAYHAADTGVQVARTVVDTGRSAAGAGKSAVQRSLELRRHLAEERRRHLEERLAILEDGGDARTGRMNWWVGNTLRNNPTFSQREKYRENFELFERLRASSHRYHESFEKMEARIEAEKQKEKEAESSAS